jgi:hypothetical protein
MDVEEEEESKPLDKAAVMCDTTATEAPTRLRRGVAAEGVDGRRESLVRDASSDVLHHPGVPEQLKSGKQNKQQLLLG